jgi:hypothetical protein
MHEDVVVFEKLIVLLDQARVISVISEELVLIPYNSFLKFLLSFDCLSVHVFLPDEVDSFLFSLFNLLASHKTLIVL